MIDHSDGRRRMELLEHLKANASGALNSIMDQRLLGAIEASRYCLTGESRALDSWIQDSIKRIRAKHAQKPRPCDCRVCRGN